MITLIQPSASAASVPGRICRNRSACWATSLKRGSMTMSLAPRSLRFVFTQSHKSGSDAMVLRPHSTTRPAFTQSDLSEQNPP